MRLGGDFIILESIVLVQKNSIHPCKLNYHDLKLQYQLISENMFYKV